MLGSKGEPLERHYLDSAPREDTAAAKRRAILESEPYAKRKCLRRLQPVGRVELGEIAGDALLRLRAPRGEGNDNSWVSGNDCGCTLIADVEDVPGQRVARKPALLQLRIRQPAQGFVESCGCPIVSAALHPRREAFGGGSDRAGKRRCCFRYYGFVNDSLLMECHGEYLLAL